MFLVLFFLASSVGAHESRPGYLQLTLTGEETVNLLLKIPALGNMRLGLYPNLPANCEAEGTPTSYIVDNAYIERAAFQCSGGLYGGTITIDGLSTTLTDVLVRVERPDGTTQVALLTPAAPAFVVEATPDAIAIART
ncbi:MAG: HupE/UreJ family protein, partial [Proteobacteria bacterium]|nr:HupE/UreJ family protein [Pseudomonadota bacterium]